MPKGKAKSVTLQLRVTAHELELLHRRRKALGLSMSAYLHRVVMGTQTSELAKTMSLNDQLKASVKLAKHPEYDDEENGEE